MSDQNQRSLLILNQSDYMVKTVLDVVGLLADVLLLLAIGHGGSFLVKTILLLHLGLGTVLVEELEGLGGRVAVQGVLELRDGRGHLETHAQNLLLALQLDIFGPLDEARQVPLGLDILADAKVTGSSLDEGVLYTDSLLVQLKPEQKKKKKSDLPWRFSCYHLPYPEDKAKARLSFQTWEAVIEKRRSATLSHDAAVSFLALENPEVHNPS